MFVYSKININNISVNSSSIIIVSNITSILAESLVLFQKLK